MRLGLVYLPDVSAAELAVRCARDLAAGRAPRVVVGPGKLPHITLLHVESARDAEALWREARGAIAPRLDYRIRALELLRYETPYNAPPAPPASMAYLMVERSPELLEAERRAMRLPFIADGPDEVTTGNGDRFVPHLTIAIWEGALEAASSPLPAELRDRTFSASLALGVIGANGVYERSLFTSEEEGEAEEAAAADGP